MIRQRSSTVFRTSFSMALVALTVAVGAHATLTSVGADSESAFRAVGPGSLKIEGTGKGVQVSQSGSVLTVTVPVTGLKTGMTLRDDHLKKAIHAAAHPAVTLAVERAALKFPEDGKSSEATASGKLTLNGQTREVKFSYKAARTGSDYHVQGSAQIDITAFGLEKPCYLGVCVDKDVKIRVKFKVREG